MKLRSYKITFLVRLLVVAQCQLVETVSAEPMHLEQDKRRSREMKLKFFFKKKKQSEI
mgnify:CR=1